MEKAEEATAKWAAAGGGRKNTGEESEEDKLHFEYVFLGRES